MTSTAAATTYALSRNPFVEDHHDGVDDAVDDDAGAAASIHADEAPVELPHGDEHAGAAAAAATSWKIGMANSEAPQLTAEAAVSHPEAEEEDEDEEEGDENPTEMMSDSEWSAMDPEAAARRAQLHWTFDFNSFVCYHKRASVANATALVLLIILFRYVGTPLRAHIAMTERRVFPRPVSASRQTEETHLVQMDFPLASLSFVALACQLIENSVCGWLCVRPVERMLRTKAYNRIRAVSASCGFMCLFVQAAICVGVSDPLEIFFVALSFILLCAMHSTDAPDATFPVRLYVARLGWVVYSVLLLAGTIHTAQFADNVPIAFVCFAAMLLFGGLLYMVLWFQRGVPAASPQRTFHFGRERNMYEILLIMQQLAAWLFVLGM